MSVDTFTAIRACALVLLTGAVLQAESPEGAVTAGKGSIIDWRTVRCGETIQTESDPFDTAQLFVALVGPDAALLAANRDAEVELAPPIPEPAPRITTWAADDRGNRRRQFEVGNLRILVEALPWLYDLDDSAAALFTERLAELAQAVER